MPHDYYARSVRALQLADMSESTQEAYTRAVRMLVEFYEKPPEQITEEELQQYFLYRRNIDGWSSATLRIAISGVRFYFVNVLERDWRIFSYLKAKRAPQLPSILDRSEVYRILGCVHAFHYYTCLAVIYACGLRISEAIGLQVADIHGKRNLIHVHRGKGAKDRYVPLPTSSLQLMRSYWSKHRHRTFLFPACARSYATASAATKPMTIAGVQEAFRKAKVAAGITKRRVTVHTFRHCYATHLLEAGVSVRAVQAYLGHSRLQTTAAYLHFTESGMKEAFAIIDSTMKGFGFRHDHGQ
jgi:integrase/recombinase XerD